MSTSPKTSPKQLPSDPSLEQLKNQARDLLKAHRARSPEVCPRIRVSLRRLSASSDADILDAAVTLRDAQSVMAREFGFSSWAKLKAHIEGRSDRKDARQEILQALSERPEEVGRALRAIQGDAKQVGPLLVAMGQETAAQMMRRLSDTGIELVTQAIAGLGRLTEEAQNRALEAFAQRVRPGDPPDQEEERSEHREFLQGALELAVGRPKAIGYMDKHGIPADRTSKPRLTQQYQAMKRELAKRLKGKRTTDMDPDEIRAVIRDMAQVVRAEGILALEAYFDRSANVEGLLAAGMRLAIDGTEPDHLKDMLETQKNTLVHGTETRCDMIIAGVMAIRQGVPWRLIDQKLASFYKS